MSGSIRRKPTGRYAVVVLAAALVLPATAQDRARATRPGASPATPAAARASQAAVTSATAAPTDARTAARTPGLRNPAALGLPDEAPRELFHELPAGIAAVPAVVRRGPATLSEVAAGMDLTALPAAGQAPVMVTLPGGRTYRAVPLEFESRGTAGYSWRGRLLGAGEVGEAVITVWNGHAAGLLTLPHRLVEIVPEAPGVVRLQEIEDSLFPPCAGDHDIPVTLPAAVAPAPRAAETSWIDVLVLYTRRARVAAGGVPQIETAIRNAIDVTNDAYASSDVTQRVYLVGVQEIAYDEGGIPMEEQLDWLRESAAVLGLRNRLGADAVALIAESPDYCGIGFVMREPSPAYADWAFSVTHRPCLVGGRTLAHELGHNMGLEHDPPNGPPPADASYPWSFGHFVPRTFRTIMAYADPCGPGCVSVGHFSNPRVQYQGHPTGIAGRRDNARTLNLTAPLVERFRAGLADPPDNLQLSVALDTGLLVQRAVYQLRWDAHPLADGYHVYRALGDGAPQRITAAPLTSLQFFETGPPQESGRGYAVSAVLADGSESRRSAFVWAEVAP